MPITYTRSSLGHTSHLTNVSDADESIVLSDLVRSGEVSRLRRRGAIAIRDMTAPQSPVPLPAPPPVPATTGVSRHSSASLLPLAPTPPEPDLSETDEDEVEQRQNGVGRWFFRSRLNLRDLSMADFNDSDPLLFSQDAEARVEDEDEDFSYVLFCGGRLRESEWYNHSDAQRTSEPPAPARYRASAFRPPPATRRPSHVRARRTNGCGVLIHLNAEPRRRQGTWVACGAAAETVVRMDTRYFDRYASVKMIRSACGCVREGVGCRVCGNPLGIIYVPCQAAADGLNIPRGSSSASSSTARTQPQPAQADSFMHPPGPNYWLPSVDACQRRRRSGTVEIFNFFSERVRSAPEFTFPPIPLEAVPQSMRSSSPEALATSSQPPPASSMPESLASRPWAEWLPMPSVDNIQQASDLSLDGQVGEVARNSGNASHPDEVEVDNAEKPEDFGMDGGGQIPWAER